MSSSSKIHAVFAGEAMIEIVPDPNAPTHAAMNVAGDVFNSAVYFKRAMGSGGDVQFLSALGDDAFSDMIRAKVSLEDISTQHIRVVPGGQCGLYAVSTDAQGERSFAYWRSTSAARTLFSTDSDFKACEPADVVVLSGISIAILSDKARQKLLDWLVVARKDGLRVAFDSNYRPRLWDSVAQAQHWIGAFWNITDIGFPSVDDEQALFGETDLQGVLARFQSYGIPQGALKAGGQGAVLLGDTNDLVKPIRKPNVRDTTAAGDSFNAGFLAALLSGSTPTNAALAGHALAGRVIEHRGAILPR
ncbi:MAG: sugar kinase [Paracoccaceae bacterium]